MQLTSTRRKFYSVLTLAMACALSLGQSLDTRIDALIARAPLGSAQVGVAVFDIDTGELIAGSDASRAMIPASNMKLITSGAALLTLGNEFAFRTEFLIDDTDGRTTLIIKGDGDPALGDPELLGRGTTPLDVNGLLERIAGALHKQGIDHLDHIVIDDRVFDRETLHPAWPTNQLNRWYCAEIAGLNFYTNTVTVFPQARGEGEQPRLIVEPSVPWIEMRNNASSVDRGSNTVWVSRPDRSNTMTIYGDVRRRAEIPVAIADPAIYSGRVIATAMDDHGISIGPTGTDPISRVRLIREGEQFPDATPVAIVRTTLTDILSRCNTDSHNLYAEALLKRTGHAVTGEPGSWSNGASVTRMLFTEHLGPNVATEVTISDGSGMSRLNQVPPIVIAQWLGVLYEDDEIRDTLLDSLPGPGQGTLRERFMNVPLKNRLKAKSGFLDGIYALSGILINDEGRAVAFSILLNNVPSGKASRSAKPLHEDIVTEIDRWLAAQSVPAFGG